MSFDSDSLKICRWGHTVIDPDAPQTPPHHHITTTTTTTTIATNAFATSRARDTYTHTRTHTHTRAHTHTHYILLYNDPLHTLLVWPVCVTRESTNNTREGHKDKDCWIVFYHPYAIKAVLNAVVIIWNILGFGLQVWDSTELIYKGTTSCLLRKETNLPHL